MNLLDEFIEYLKQQVGEPYVWGGQHTKLTPENYKEVIRMKENSEEHADAAISHCKKLFDEGATVLYAYDCSGLGCYWLYNLMHLYKSDVTANTMMSRCSDITKINPPKRGWWVFRLDGKRASHIGYMIDDEYLIEAKGRKYGVVKTKFKISDWDQWGVPNVFKDVINASEDSKGVLPNDNQEPVITSNKGLQMVEVIGGSVNVRDADNKDGKALFTAHSKKGYKAKGINHENDIFELIDIAPSGWYHIMTYKGEGYISNKEKYTKLVNI